MIDSHTTAAPQPFSLGRYLLIVFGLSWPFLIASAIWFPNIWLRFAFNTAAMIMVMAGTYIAARSVFRDGFASMGWNWGKPIHYVWITVLVVVLLIVPALVESVVGIAQAPVASTLGLPAWITIILFGTVIPAFGEEFGWRGYLLPRLARRSTPRRAILLHSVIWWVWHIPIIAGAGIRSGLAEAQASGENALVSAAVAAVVVVLIGAIPTIFHGVIFAYIWTRSRSLAVATVYHTAFDGLRAIVGLIILIDGLFGLWMNVIFIVLGLILLVRGNWQGITGDDDAPIS